MPLENESEHHEPVQLGPVHDSLLISGQADAALYIPLLAGAIAAKAWREALRGNVLAAHSTGGALEPARTAPVALVSERLRTRLYTHQLQPVRPRR